MHGQFTSISKTGIVFVENQPKLWETGSCNYPTLIEIDENAVCREMRLSHF